MKYTLGDFINRKFVVNCTTIEDAKKFIEICKNNEIGSKDILSNWEILKSNSCYSCRMGSKYKWLTNGSKQYFESENIKVIDFKEFIGGNKMNKEKTLKEIVNDNKEGEIWEDEYVEISCKNNGLYVISKDGKKYDGVLFKNDKKYKLKRKEYDFTKAYKAYKEGKEIESLVSGYRLKIIDGIDMFHEKNCNGWDSIESIEYKEIDGKWYIND